MPLPYWVARFNRRIGNRLLAPLVRRSRHYAEIEHRGRRTGATHTTPVFAFFGPGTGCVPVTYGHRTDWTRNVVAGGGWIRHRSGTFDLSAMRIGQRGEVAIHLPGWVRLLLAMARVDSFAIFEI